MTNWQAGAVLAWSLQSVVLAITLLRVPERAANRPLGLALLVLAGMLIVYPLGWHGREEVPVWLNFLPINLPLALGPLLYLHVRSVAQVSGKTLRHMAPALVQLLYLGALSLVPHDAASAWKEGVHDAAVKPLVELAVLVSLTGYSVAGLMLLRTFKARLRAERSDADRHDARWLSRLLGTLVAALVLLTAVRTYTSLVGELDAGPYLFWLGAWSAWLGIEGWRAARLPSPELPTTEERDPPAPSRDWQAMGLAWQARTREAGWWRDPELTLHGLARRLGTNAVYLSRAVNDGLGMNFNEMVNRLRSEEVARRIGEGAAGDLLSIALEAGFSSKATFNRCFRATYGMSPSAYRARLRS